MADSAGRLEVLLATYNGARFLGEQLQSLLAQTVSSFRILVRDDGSVDGTAEILRDHAQRFPDRIVLLPTGKTTLGPAGNFTRLLEHSTADYVLFSDQDDVWLADKVEITLAKMRELEARHGPATPLLVHTDLKVVAADLQPLGESFWAYQHLVPVVAEHLNRLLVQNVITGCTTMVNRPLVRLAAPVPEGAIMHDWWLGLTAAAFGQIGHLSQPTVLYRQHGANDTGAQAWGASYILRQAYRFFDNQELQESLRQTQRQAGLFLARFADRLDHAQHEAVRTYAQLEQASFLMRRWLILKHGYYKVGWIRNLALLCRV